MQVKEPIDAEMYTSISVYIDNIIIILSFYAYRGCVHKLRVNISHTNKKENVKIFKHD